MNVVHPFPSRIVRQEWAARVVSPMLDSLGASERLTLLEAEEDATPLPQPVHPSAYDESPPALFVYRLRHGSSEHTGVVGEVEAEAFLSGQVRGHESVQADRVRALARRFAVAPARSELVALLHRAGPAVERVVDQICRTRPAIRFTGPDGVEQTIWRVTGERETTALSEELSRAVHYIADGHHRVAASLHEWQQVGRPAGTGLLCVMYPLDGLHLAAFNRRVSGPVDEADLLTSLSAEFEVSHVCGPADTTGCFGLYIAGQWYDGSFTGARRAGAAGLDVAILHDRVLAPILGIATMGDPRLDVASARTPVTDLTARCDEDGGALFVLRAPAVGELTAVADSGEVMMPKTTYFEPKPQAGIFLR